MTEKHKHVLNALNYLEAEGIVEKSYKNGEAYYSLTEEGAAMPTTKKTNYSTKSKKTLKDKKSLLLIR